jgi:hypothetical protein
MNKALTMRLLLATATLSVALTGGLAYGDARVYAHVHPPAPIVEHRAVAPSPRHVWIDGHHAWNGTEYSWAPGRWELPPRPNARWSGGKWRQHKQRGWYYVEGRWR